MHEAWPHLVVDVERDVLLFGPVQERVDERACAMARGRMHDEPGGLVDHR